RADRARARTECPAASAAFTVSRPIPLLAPMIRTVATPVNALVNPPLIVCAIKAAAAQDDGRRTRPFLEDNVRFTPESGHSLQRSDLMSFQSLIVSFERAPCR